ncbi:hypothetical protein Angca_005360, partial [Angiostrongylus cantonensis]
VLRLALPHVTLLLVSLVYAGFGGWILTIIKYSDHTNHDAELLESTKKDFIRFVLSMNSSQNSMLENRYTMLIDNLYDIHARSPYQWNRKFTASIHSHPLSNVTWNLFFAATTLTSIGYGADAPDSYVGRMFCLAYLFFGIPLFLITLADLAKFCTEFMNKLYIDIIKCKYQLKKNYARWKSGQMRRDSVQVGQLIIAGGEDEVAEFLLTHLDRAQFVEIPFFLIIGIFLAYITIASHIISVIEGWPLSDGFYFVMVSVLTIGFGDLVPRNQTFILVVLLLILVGLVLTTTCVDIVGAYYIDRLHFFGRRLDDDPLSWLKEVQQRRIEAMKREAMRKLLETVTALHHIRLTELPAPPRNLIASQATADSVFLRWNAPLYVDEGKRYWYTLTYKPRLYSLLSNEHTKPQRRRTRCFFVGMHLSTSTRGNVTGTHSPTNQGYTRCFLMSIQNLSEVKCDKKWFGLSSYYVILFIQEPAPQFIYWNRYKVGDSTRFTLTDLLPDTPYILCVLAEHNHGLTAMSRSLRFRTRRWWIDDDSSTCLHLPHANRRTSMSSVVSSLSALR